MQVEIASVACGGAGLKLPGDIPITIFDNTANKVTPCQAYQSLLDATQADVLVYCHDDVSIHDPQWLSRLLVLLSNPLCVAAGPGGATGLGTRDLYRKRFDIHNMIRVGYGSNQDDAEVHGERFTGNRRVSVLEQFCMAVRVSWLRKIGGWPVDRLSHHMLDAFVACEAARGGKEVWQSGFACHHAGGASSTHPMYRGAVWLQGGSMESDHILPHQWIFSEYSDVLPLDVTR